MISSLDCYRKNHVKSRYNPMKEKNKAIAILLSIGTFISILVWRIIANWPNIKQLASDINLHSMLQWLKRDIAFPQWLLLMFLLLFLATICIVAYVLIKRLRTIDLEVDYTQDCFEKYSPVVFEWEYCQHTGESISNLKPLCPKDMTELKFGPHSHYNNNPAVPILYCRKCDFGFDVDPDHNVAGISYQNMTDYIVSQIEANIRSNNWKKASRRVKRARKLAK